MRRLRVALLLALVGCDDGGGAVDPGAPDARRDAAADVPAPDAEAPPDAEAGPDRLRGWACPAGWAAGVDVPCEPPPVPTCVPGALPLPSGECVPRWPCPEAWRRMENGGCGPPESALCPGGWPVPGGCVSDSPCIGDRFGDHDWPADTVFVDSAAEAPGDGSRARPFATVDEAGAAATLALAPGRYRSPAPVAGPRRIGGRCRAEVVLAGRVSGPVVQLHDLTVLADDPVADGALLVAPGDELRAARVRIHGPGVPIAVRGGSLVLEDSAVGPGPGLAVSGGRLTLRRVHLRELVNLGALVAAEGHLELDRVRFDDVRPDESPGIALAAWGGRIEGADVTITGASETGVFARAGADVDLARLMVRETARGRGYGVNAAGGRIVLRDALLVGNSRTSAVADGGQLELERVVVSDTRRAPGSEDRFGIAAVNGAELTVRGARVEGGGRVGIYVVRGASAVVEEVGVLDVGADADGIGVGVLVNGSTLTLRRSVVARSATVGLAAIEGADLRAEDVALLDHPGGSGLGVIAADVAATDVRIDGAAFAGVAVDGASRVELTRLLCRRTRARPGEQVGGQGMSLVTGADVTLTDAVFLDNREAGALVSGVADPFAGPPPKVTATRVAFAGTRANGAVGGVGIELRNGAALQADGLWLADIEHLGVAVFAARLEATDLHLGPVSPRAADGASGRGLNAQGGARVSLRRARIEGAHEVGLRLSGAGTTLDAVELDVVGTAAAGGGFGTGIEVADGATARIESGRVRGNSETGVVVIDATLEGIDLDVRGTTPGALDFGDGIYVDGGALTLSGVVLVENARAGLVVSNASAVARGGEITGNAVGVVRQLETRVDLVDVRVSGNAEDDRRCDGVCFERPAGARPSEPLPD